MDPAGAQRRSALVLFAHGARDPEWSLPFRNVQRRIMASRPALRVELAFLELMPPSLGEVLEHLASEGYARIAIAPLFMAQGGHLKQDLPRLLAEVRARHPHVALNLLPAVGESEVVLESISNWLLDAVQR